MYTGMNEGKVGTIHDIIILVIAVIVLGIGTVLYMFIENKNKKKIMLESFEMSDIIIAMYQLDSYKEKYKKETDKYAEKVKFVVLSFIKSFTGVSMTDSEKYNMAMELIAQIFMKTRFVWTQDQKKKIDDDVLNELVLVNMKKNNTSGDNNVNISLGK